MEHRHRSYDSFLSSAMDLDFIDNEEKADKAIKMVLGILASKLNEENAYKLTDRLPEPLTYDRLRSHQENITPISADQYIEEVRTEFNISDGQAKLLISKVWSVTQDIIGEDTMQQLESALPPDWANLMAKVT